jgi:conjugative relaxase-like TrwC/TraI family protein
VLSIRRVSLGGGFRYLMDSVAAGDTGARPADGLAAYYTATGTPPGRFLGSGLADLDGGNGVPAGAEVSEEHLRLMLGGLCDPVSAEPVGHSPILSAKRAPVAGFDLTFSPPKSVSVAWALADPETKAVIYDCHLQAINHVLAYAEHHVCKSRSGPSGVVEEDVTGVVAAAFTHWDSRAGDPQLHDHVIVWNRARSVSDGAWRTLDSRGLFKASVMLSELHQGVLSDLLTQALGVGWERRARRHSEHRRYEITGVPETLMEEFSRRAGQVEIRATELSDRFVTAHGRHPTNVEAIQLRQQATLETRPEKTHRRLVDMAADWRDRATPYVGSRDEQVAWVAGLAGRNDLPLLHAGDLADPILQDAARAAREAVAVRRATFSQHNVVAEALRILHGARFVHPGERVAVATRITALAVQGCLLLNPPALEPTPDAYRRPDGTSRLAPESRKLYTTQAVLDAEARLLDAAGRLGGPVVPSPVVTEVTTQPLPRSDRVLSGDQVLAVEHIATSGRSLDVLVGPAGTGKSVTMAALRSLWETTYGPGSVTGLAPSAAAAEVLATELGIPTENTAMWLTRWRQIPDLVARRQRLASSPPSLARQHHLDRLDTAIAARHPRPASLIIIDEASLAGTLALDELVTAATTAGAKILLVGDPAQLPAVEAGGSFRLLVDTLGDLTAQLSQVHRFTHDWEATASLALRQGNSDAIPTYQSRDRISHGQRDQVLDALYRAWKADIDAGRLSLMIAPDRATVNELNQRARAERVTAGTVTGEGARLADGQTAGVGDVVVTRRNDRRLSNQGVWVKNGDRWTVTAVHRNGRVRLQQAQGGGEVVLPRRYVAQHIELGYAITAHQAQGRTVDTAHSYITLTTTRQILYIAASRGRHGNHLYVDTHYDPDPDTGHDNPTAHQDPAEVLRTVLATDGTEPTAHETLRRLYDHAAGSASRPSDWADSPIPLDSPDMDVDAGIMVPSASTSL